VTFLLDVNILIALVDRAHLHSAAVHAWFLAEGGQSFATCPLTENALLRIVGNPRYPNGPGSPALVMPLLESVRGLPGHEFWPDDISLSNSALVDPGGIAATGQITDIYLLALAVSKRGRFATLDRKLVPHAVPGGREALVVIEAQNGSKQS